MITSSSNIHRTRRPGMNCVFGSPWSDQAERELPCSLLEAGRLSVLLGRRCQENRKPTVVAMPCSLSTSWARTRTAVSLGTMAADDTKESKGLVHPMKMNTFISVGNVAKRSRSSARCVHRFRKNRRIRAIPELCSQICDLAISSRLSTRDQTLERCSDSSGVLSTST